MTKIFKQLARHWAVCLVVFALLFVQAYCDLSLPDYTSKIVDTGIQQGGIESPLPETVRQSTLDALSLLMSEEDADALQNARSLVVTYDLTVDELFGKQKSTGKAVAVKYRNPETGETWTGRGRAPRWLEGKNREDFAV